MILSTITVLAAGGVAAAPPEGSAVKAGTASVSLLILCLLAAWICVKTKGAQWPHIAIGIAIGVVGQASFIGTITWEIIDIIVGLLNKAGASF